MRLSLAMLLAGVLAPTAVHAMDPGFYAGVYAGGGQRTGSDFEFASGAAYPSDQSATGQPDGYVNAGLPSLPFDLLNLGLSDFPGYVDSQAGLLHMLGSLAYRGGPSAGVVVGYGFGNGARIEADLSTMLFSASEVDLSYAILFMGIDGNRDGSDVWTWTPISQNSGAVDESTTFDILTQGGVLTSSASFLLLSGYFDIETGTGITPYLGGGVGMALLNSTYSYDCSCDGRSNFADSALVPAAQIGGGLRFAVSEPVTLDIGYRYRMTGSASLTSGELMVDTADESYLVRGQRETGMLGIHSIQAGLTFALP